MKIIISLIVLFFSSVVKADDISDLEIEGMSIGDSLLNFFSEEEINQNLEPTYFNWKKNKKFITAEFAGLNSFKKYNAVQAQIKLEDNKFIIYSIGGMMDYNIQDCYYNQEKVVREISAFIGVNKFEIVNAGKQISKGDISGKSTYTSIYLDFLDGSYIDISCYDWSIETGFIDHLRITINGKEFGNWLNADN